MDFFESQDDARKKTSLLVLYYVLAVVLIILAVYVAFAATFIGVKAKTGGEIALRQLWNPQFFLWVVGGALAVVIAGTFYKISQLSEGGAAVARMMGGRPIRPGGTNSNERKVLNIVEEMAIASGVPVPPVFVLAGEKGINAFAAGFTPGDAVIGVTSGCIEQLSRDELQGVIAHEFSHILNGDMRLNIRLMGVLNGILVIGLVGYWIMRSTLGTGRRSRSGSKGNSMPIAVLGLVIMAIGFIGVFFGKLIKSAVSRQREFLADASSVQFTRNPLGISSALKKIGGYTAGSRIISPHAEEASHLFFSNGMAQSFANLLATHPPLTERIRRLDASFDPERVTQQAAPPRSAASAAHGGVTRFAVDPGTVVSHAGSPTAKHIAYAGALMAAMPRDLLESAREPFGARAVIYALLLNQDAEARDRQLKHLSQHADTAVNSETLRIGDALTRIGPQCRLPLVDMAMTALKALSGKQYSVFDENVKHLVQADRQVDLFEYTLQHMIRRYLDPVFHKRKPDRVRFTDMRTIAPKCVELLSCLAGWGADDAAAAEHAFACGIRELNLQQTIPMIPPDSCGLQMLDDALDQLVRASGAIKKKILAASVACIGADGKVTLEEAELIRAVAASLGCPIPPFLPE